MSWRNALSKSSSFPVPPLDKGIRGVWNEIVVEQHFSHRYSLDFGFQPFGFREYQHQSLFLLMFAALRVTIVFNVDFSFFAIDYNSIQVVCSRSGGYVVKINVLYCDEMEEGYPVN